MSDTQHLTLITGGTKGIGLATALAFARVGSQCIITYGWGSVEEEAVTALFAEKNYKIPLLFQADVASVEDTSNLMQGIVKKFGKVKIDVFVSNVCCVNFVRSFADYSEKALLQSIKYSTWPVVAYIQQMYQTLGRYPGYVIGLSSRSHESFQQDYDFAAVSKALMETLIKYLSCHLLDHKVIFNLIRIGIVETDSMLAVLGKTWKKYLVSGTEMDAASVAKTIVMLCSGLMDGIRGQIITADKGYDFAEGLQDLYADQKTLKP